MTDLEISKVLAIAIGWKPEQMHINGHILTGHTLMIQRSDGHFARPFDYRDWNVIAPIAAKYDGFPRQVSARLWHACAGFNHSAYGDTPQKAIALAVIGAMK